MYLIVFILCSCLIGPNTWCTSLHIWNSYNTIMSVPTVTIDEVSQGVQDHTTNPSSKKVLEGMLNDFMDLQYGKETPYTTGKQVVPSGASISDVDNALSDDSTDIKFRAVFQKISDTVKSGDLTPEKNDGSWDPKLTPVLVLIRPNN